MSASNNDLEILKHDLRVQRMLVEEHKAKAKRLAVEAAFYKKLWKDSRKLETPAFDGLSIDELARIAKGEA